MTVKVEEGSTAVLVRESVAATVLPLSPGVPAVLVEQNQSMVLVQPASSPETPVTVDKETIVLQESAGPTAVVFAGSAITVQATGGGAEVLPNRTLRGAGGNIQYLYVGFSSAAIGSENEAAAEWKIYRYDTVSDTSLYADGNTAFDNIWDNRESLTYS